MAFNGISQFPIVVLLKMLRKSFIHWYSSREKESWMWCTNNEQQKMQTATIQHILFRILNKILYIQSMQ